MQIKNSKKQASSIIFIIFFLIMFLAFAAFAIDGTIVLTNRAKLQTITEMTALSAASEFNYSSMASNAQIVQKVTDTANDVFNLLKQDALSSASITVNVNSVTAPTRPTRVLIKANAISQPFFLAFLGVTGIKLEAKACAVSEDLNVKANYLGVNWLTNNAAYFSDILSKDLNLNDTAILLPLGDFPSASYISGLVNFGFISSEDNQPLSLGPGGFITIKLPVPIIDKPGYDLYIKEANTIEGYLVYVGLDNNPDNPYVQHGNEGGGISWVNISCSGISDKTDANNFLGAYTVSTDNLGIQNRFYGSGYFDLGASCVGGISMAKYLRIVDDNDESGFVTNDNISYNKVKLYGEASTATSGADIDAVKVLNHVRLMPSSSF